MRRKNRFETYKDAVARGAYDEMPMLEVGIDPQVHLSRNEVAQPFFLVCEQDTVLAQMSGTARVEFRNSPVNYFEMALGDFVYVPGGTPHRILPKTESVQLRYKAEHPGLEAVAWYSDTTGEEISRVTWDCAEELPQQAYLRACTSFNADAKMRTCPTTGATLPAIDLAKFRWAEVAAEILEAESAEQARAQKKGITTPPRGLPSPKRAIATAPGDKPPLKTNVFDFTRAVPTALAPMFPYLDPGCIVPCVTMHDAAWKGEKGYFVHANTVQEVNLCFGSRDGYRAPGDVGVGPFTHPVGDKPGQPVNNNFINIAVITQRQSVDKPQSESFIFMCEKCNAEVFRHDYGAYDLPDAFPKGTDPQLLGMPTVQQSDYAALTFNGSETNRTCKKCNHVNAPFPVDYWAWSPYRRRTRIIVEARDIMMKAASAAAAEARAAE
jgi:3-hydroxyanthranilate 3,4-dioxygenase